MKKLILLSLLLTISACESDPSKSKECIQAKNRNTVYTKSLTELKSLYSDDINSAEAKRRISAMESRIETAKHYINTACTRKP